ncbi:MAG: zinc-ribbon domain-containing protein [Chlorobi bacterium]|nr:zinc-ribbon domain-containing protein [Chlorobiota bacterium]
MISAQPAVKSAISGTNTGIQIGLRRVPQQTVQCLHCGAVGFMGERFCVCCGVQLPRKCRRCGAAIRHQIANYCPHCGTRV